MDKTIKELRLNPIKIKKSYGNSEKDYITPDDNQFIIGKKYELKNPFLSNHPIALWFQTKDENGDDVYIPEWCFESITEDDIQSQESEIEKLERELKQKRAKLNQDKEKFFSSNLRNKNGKINILKRIIRETYRVNDDFVDRERQLSSGIDFGSFFGPDRASTATHYIWFNEIIEWFENNLDKYGDKIMVSDKPVFGFDWSKEKIAYRTSEDNTRRLHDRNHKMLIDTIRRCNSDGPLEREKPKIVTEMRLDEVKFGFRYDYKDGKYDFDNHTLDDDSKKFVHDQLTSYFDKLLKRYKFIIIGNIWCYNSKEFRNYNPFSTESLYNIHLRVRGIEQEEIDRRIKEAN